MMQKNKGIIVSFNNDKTLRLGLSLYDISSGLQKSIRRGNFNDACIYTRELIESGQINYIWKKIYTYIVEDIGLGNLYIAELINKLYEKFKIIQTSDIFDDQYIYMAIYLITISPKNRETDNFYCLLGKYDGISNDSNDISIITDYCKKEIYSSKSKKIKEQIMGDLYFSYYLTINKEIYNHYTTAMLNFWELNGDSGLNLYFILFYLIKKYNISMNYYTEGKNEWGENKKSLLKELRITFDNQDFKVKDYIYDMHTYKGKNELNRGYEHFFKEGAFLENKVEINNNYYEKELYKKLNII